MRLIEAIKSRWIVWVWSHTPTCAEMARLTSLTLERPPSFSMRVGMWLHRLICVWCERYRKHIEFLHRAAPRSPDHFDDHSHRPLSEVAKKRMVEKLHEAAGA
jgi:hypothetical protein